MEQVGSFIVVRVMGSVAHPSVSPATVPSGKENGEHAFSEHVCVQAVPLHCGSVGFESYPASHAHVGGFDANAGHCARFGQHAAVLSACRAEQMAARGVPPVVTCGQLMAVGFASSRSL